MQLALPGTHVVGVDPAPRLTHRYPRGAIVEKRTSDDFFASCDVEQLLGGPIDLCLIDGMHQFEFALRDFLNVERHTHYNSVVVFDDPYPRNARQASRTLMPGRWAGDVWKTIAILREIRTDLTIHVLDVFPTGLAVVTNFNPEWSISPDLLEAVIERHLRSEYSSDLVKAALQPETVAFEELGKELPGSARPGVVPLLVAGRALRVPSVSVSRGLAIRKFQEMKSVAARTRLAQVYAERREHTRF